LLAFAFCVVVSKSWLKLLWWYLIFIRLAEGRDGNENEANWEMQFWKQERAFLYSLNPRLCCVRHLPPPVQQSVQVCTVPLRVRNDGH
jgi:hypothetical protein